MERFRGQYFENPEKKPELSPGRTIHPTNPTPESQQGDSERLDLHKQWHLIESITPSMPPEQAVAQVQLFNQIDKERNVVNLPLFEVREKLLEEYGYNPSDWVFYSNDSSSKSPEEKMAKLAKPFPLGVEFLVLPGHFIGGVLYGETPTLNVFGVAKNKYFSFGHSCFIRVKPKQISSGEEMQK